MKHRKSRRAPARPHGKPLTRFEEFLLEIAPFYVGRISAEEMRRLCLFYLKGYDDGCSDPR